MSNIFSMLRDKIKELTSEPEPGSRGYSDFVLNSAQCQAPEAILPQGHSDSGQEPEVESQGEMNKMASGKGDNSMVDKQSKKGKGYGVLKMPGIKETPTHGIARQEKEKASSSKLFRMPKVEVQFLGKRKPKTKAEQQAEREKELAQVGRGERPGKQGVVTSTSGNEKLAEREASGRKLVTAGRPTTTGEQYRKPRAERQPVVSSRGGFRISPRFKKLPRG